MIKAGPVWAPGEWITSALIATASKRHSRGCTLLATSMRNAGQIHTPAYQVFIEEAVNRIKFELNFAIAEPEAPGRTAAISV